MICNTLIQVITYVRIVLEAAGKVVSILTTVVQPDPRGLQ